MIHHAILRLKMSTQTALEKLRQIGAGEVVLNSAKSPVITALGDEHKAIYKQLEISLPKIRQLQGL